MRFLLLFALSASVATAQPSAWDLPLDGTSIWLTALESSYDSFQLSVGADAFDPDDAISGTASVLGGVIDLGRVAITTEIPFALVRTDTEVVVGPSPSTTRETGAVVGNVQIGAQTEVLPDVHLGAAVRLPTATALDYQEPGFDADLAAQSYGLTADYERLGAFLSRALTVSASADGQKYLTPSVVVRAHLVPQIIVFTGSSSFEDPVALVGYGLQALYEADRFRAGLAGHGVSRLTGTIGYGDHIYSVGALADVRLGAFQPGLQIRVPLTPDTLESTLDAVFGLRLAYVVG